MCLEATSQKRPYEATHSQPAKAHADYQQSSGSKGSSKGGKNNKGKGGKTDKGNGKRARGQGRILATNPGERCKPETNDGTKIWYRYNNQNVGCKNPKCSFAHVCGICFAAGVPLFRCSHGGQIPK